MIRKNKNMKTDMKNKEKAVAQIVAVPRIEKVQKTNGHVSGKAADLDINSRTFETRFIPRYKKIPA